MGCLEVDNVVELIQLCDEHCVCHDCIRSMIRLAIDDENHYPLSCGGPYCWHIDDGRVRSILTTDSDEDAALLQQFLAKTEEYNVPAAARIYCASKDCCTAQGHSRFVNPEVLGEDTAVICPDCSSITCRLCRDLVVPDKDHICRADDLDAVVCAYIETLPEDDRWLWQKCYSCRSWINKSEACNHITCRCTAQFCLICGRKWEDGRTSCRHGCPHYAKPVYDEEGFNQFGYHKYTGLDRDGEPWDSDLDHELDAGNYDGYNGDNYDDDHYDDYGVPIYDERGFDQWGFDREGYREDGFGEHPF